jgi:hypothetical protein
MAIRPFLSSATDPGASEEKVTAGWPATGCRLTAFNSGRRVCRWPARNGTSHPGHLARGSSSPRDCLLSFLKEKTGLPPVF